MYRITLTIENPLTGDQEVIVRQFDSTQFTQVKWNGAYGAVNTSLQTLVSRSAPQEPTVW